MSSGAAAGARRRRRRRRGDSTRTSAADYSRPGLISGLQSDATSVVLSRLFSFFRRIGGEVDAVRAEEHAVLVRLGPEVRVDGPGRVIPAASLTPITACTRNCRAFGSPESSARQAAHHEPTPCAESENRNKSTLKLRARARVDTSKPRCKHGVCLQVAPPPSRRFGQPSRFNEGLPAARTAAARSGSTWSRAEPRTRSRRDAGTSTRSSKTSRTWRPARRLERLVRRRAPARRLGGPAIAALVAHGKQPLPPRSKTTRPRAAGPDAAAALDRPAKNRRHATADVDALGALQVADRAARGQRVFSGAPPENAHFLGGC